MAFTTDRYDSKEYGAGSKENIQLVRLIVLVLSRLRR